MYTLTERHMLDDAARLCGAGDGLTFCTKSAALGRDPLAYAREIIDGSAQCRAAFAQTPTPAASPAPRVVTKAAEPSPDDSGTAKQRYTEFKGQVDDAAARGDVSALRALYERSHDALRDYAYSRALEQQRENAKLVGITALAMAKFVQMDAALAFQVHTAERQALEHRIEALEQREKAMRFRGIWQRADEYQRHNFVTHDGSLWVAVSDNPGKPGDGNGWQLAAKRGRDAT